MYRAVTGVENRIAVGFLWGGTKGLAEEFSVPCKLGPMQGHSNAWRHKWLGVVIEGPFLWQGSVLSQTAPGIIRWISATYPPIRILSSSEPPGRLPTRRLAGNSWKIFQHFCV